MSEYKSNLVDVRVTLLKETPFGFSVRPPAAKTGSVFVPLELAEVYRDPSWPKGEYEITLPKPVAVRKGLLKR